MPVVLGPAPGLGSGGREIKMMLCFPDTCGYEGDGGGGGQQSAARCDPTPCGPGADKFIYGVVGTPVHTGGRI